MSLERSKAGDGDGAGMTEAEACTTVDQLRARDAGGMRSRFLRELPNNWDC
jgi:hypothetical protein